MRGFCAVMILYVLCFMICGCVSIKIDSDFSSNTDIGFKKEFYGNCKKPDNDCNQYVDPSDMRNYIHSSKTMSSNFKNCQHMSPTTGCENCAVFLQRFVGLFLGATGLKDYVLTRTNSKTVNLNLIVNRENLEVLQTFMENGNIDLVLINKALTDILTVKDSVFSEETHSSKFETIIDAIMNILKQFFTSVNLHFAEHPMHLVILTVTSVFGITLWQIIKTRSYYLLSFSLFFIIFAAGFAWNWVRLYKIADIKRFTSRILNDEIPIYCRPDQMTWYQYLFYYSSYERQCEKYFEKVMIDPIVDVSPTLVLAETITFIFHPAERLGTAIGGFVKGLITTVPWPYNILIVPLIIILTGIFTMIMMIIVTKGRLRLNVFPFSSLEISSSHSCTGNSCAALKSRLPNDLIEEVPRISENSGITGRLFSKLKSKKGNRSLKSSTSGMSENNRRELAAFWKRLNEENSLENSVDTNSVKSITSSGSDKSAKRLSKEKSDNANINSTIVKSVVQKKNADKTIQDNDKSLQEVDDSKLNQISDKRKEVKDKCDGTTSTNPVSE